MRQRMTSALVRLIAILTMAQAPARGGELAVPETRLGLRVAPLVLLGRPDVRADLQMTPEQEESARQTLEQLFSRALTLRGKPDTPEVIAARRGIDAAQQRWLVEHLSVTQQERL